MGHHTVATVINNPSVMDAFRAAKDNHQEYEGYSHSVTIPWDRRDITVLGPVTKNMVQTVLDAYENAAHSPMRERYVAAPVLDESTITRRKVKVKVTADPAHLDSRGNITWEHLEQQAKAVVKRAGEMLEGWTVVTGSTKTTTKVITETPKEKAVTKYFAHEAKTNPLDLDWERDGFATQAAARKAAVEALSRPVTGWDSPHKEFVVTPITRRETGAAMVTIKRVVTKASCEIEVTLAKSNNPSRTAGWAVAMDCHH